MVNKRYFIFNKPFGVLSQFTREIPEHKVIGDFFEFPKDIYPVGRLDKDSEGLLLLTNDNSFIERILNPDNKKSKTYLAQVDGQISEDAIRNLQNGVSIKLPSKKLYKTLPAKVKKYQGEPIEEREPPIRVRKNIPTSWIEITIHEGKNRQVRKMCAKVGFPVLRLIRTKIENFTLQNLDTGEVKEIFPEDRG